MKKLFLALMAMCFVMLVQPKETQAAPPFFFVIGVPTVAWGAFTYEDCKKDGLGFKECASKTWAEREMDKVQSIGVLRSGNYGNK